MFLTLAARFTVMTAKWPYLLDQHWLWVEMLWLTKNMLTALRPKAVVYFDLDEPLITDKKKTLRLTVSY